MSEFDALNMLSTQCETHVCRYLHTNAPAQRAYSRKLSGWLLQPFMNVVITLWMLSVYTCETIGMHSCVH